MAVTSTFPRFSPSGALILATYLLVTKISFDKSLYGLLLHDDWWLSSQNNAAAEDEGSLAQLDNMITTSVVPSSSTFLFLNSMVMAASLWNVISHAAVVLGALHDTYVLSILVGVGFDVLTKILVTVWWAHLTSILSFILIGQQHSIIPTKYDCAISASFLLTQFVIHVYQMVIHVKALRMNQSYERLVRTLHSSLNNLRGIAGGKYEDHIFAYSDLGGHLAPLILSHLLLSRVEAVWVGWCAFLGLAMVSVGVLSRVPLNSAKQYDGENINNNNGHNNKISLVRLSKEKGIECSCPACQRRVRSTGHSSCSFTFTRREGVCILWLYSFEDLSNILQRMATA
mmetsp:Transcript_19854/g.41794  ORF Transcript_19854/g.41794 Transcript_19854/m.41794 type:complete len:342 (+) Transcript_19854:205-1230(+)